MAGFLKKLFGGGGSAATAVEPEAYEGYLIYAEPMSSGGQWNVAGIIKSEDTSDERQHKFIRADTYAAREEAVKYSIIKAKQIIDERKTSVLDS